MLKVNFNILFFRGRPRVPTCTNKLSRKRRVSRLRWVCRPVSRICPSPPMLPASPMPRCPKPAPRPCRPLRGAGGGRLEPWCGAYTHTVANRRGMSVGSGYRTTSTKESLGELPKSVVYSVRTRAWTRAAPHASCPVRRVAGLRRSAGYSQRVQRRGLPGFAAWAVTLHQARRCAGCWRTPPRPAASPQKRSRRRLQSS